MKDVLLTILRNKATGMSEFRKTSDKLAFLLCSLMVEKLSADLNIEVETLLGKAQGKSIPKDIMLVPILRSGLALLPAFTSVLDCSVGVLGLKRNEETKKPEFYYKKFPRELPKKVVILDPMLATGGSAAMAVDMLLEEGYLPENVFFCGVVAAQEGIDVLKGKIPEENIVLAAVDPELSDDKFIVPGLGDFGDRYFGTL